MAFPATPSADIAILAALNGGAYDAGSNPSGLGEGGHRTNFVPAMGSTADVANWIAAVITEMLVVAAAVDADAASAAAGSGTEISAANLANLANVAHFVSGRRYASANAFTTQTFNATQTWNMNDTFNHQVTLTANMTSVSNPTNKVVGKSGILVFIMGGSGGYTIPVKASWGSDYRWFGDVPTMGGATGSMCMISYLVKGSSEVWLSWGGNYT